MASGTDDEQLMARAGKGDRQALEALVRRYAAPLLSFLTRRVQSRAEAEDLFQEVWVSVWARRRTFDTTRRFKPWLYRIACNKCADRARRVGLGPAAVFEDPPSRQSTDPDASSLKGEALAAAESAIAALPPVQREVVCLRLFVSMSYAEIADVLRITESTARSNMSHALRTLRRALRPWAEGAAAPHEETSDDATRPGRRDPQRG